MCQIPELHLPRALMEWVSLAVFLSVFQATFGFNIDPVVWKSLSSPGDGFGYKVVQRHSRSRIPPLSLLVSAPFSQDRNGQIYLCSTDSCISLSIEVPAVNMSLGLTMTNDPMTGKTMACGPTIPRECTTITTYNGACLEITADDQLGMYVPLSPEECPEASDIAFLLDGSGSVSDDQFHTMKTFVKGMIRSLVGRSTKFAVAQYSEDPTIHYHFDDFDTSGSWETQIDDIIQQRGRTYTATAIRHVVQRVFSRDRGSRPKVNKFLIVITDGVSDDKQDLSNAAAQAESRGIVRFAIGVGSAFTTASAIAELDTIATDPLKHKFQVSNFQALDGIKVALKNSIFSIEGSQTSGGSLKLEMAQEGFSAAYVPKGDGRFQMAAVGAFLWRGSYQEISTGGQRGNFKELTDMDPDSYLGYSMAIAIRKSGIFTVIGAPRYKHMGMVMVFSSSKTPQKIDPSTNPQFQIGAYFGAEVCTMDVDRDKMGYTDLILISAPSFTEKDREGRVYVCSLTRGRAECLFDSPTVLKGIAGQRGRFGSSLAPLPDLNSDGFNDLAVGAPLENDGQGSIYIFHGDGRKTINPMHSQRIPGSDVQPELRFFGLSISQSSFDLSGDSLPDLAVGSKGVVLLLRSKPIVMVEAQVTFSPDQIPTNTSCNSPLNNTAKVCFTMTNHSTVETAQAQINYTLTLDSTRKIPKNRAYIETPKQRELFNSFTLDMAKTHCFSHEFNIKACPEDALNELSNELRFTFEGVPSSTNLSPSLKQQAQTTTNHHLGFEINCGTDDSCTDNLKVDFNFTSSAEVKVGIDELLNVMVSVENREEDSYNSRVTLTYPPGLSYRKPTIQQGRVECNSSDAENGLSRGKSDCTIDKPIFKSNAKAVFTVSYGIDTNSKLDRKMLITANATSGNAEHSQESELYQQKEIDVKYSIFLFISNPSSLYTNVTFGRNDLQTPFLQSITVENTVRAFNVTVVIKVPVRLGDKDIWVNPGTIKILGCDRHNDEEPSLSDFVDNIKQDLTVDCSVARCAVFRCNVFMARNQRDIYHISANLSSGWIEQIGLQSAKFSLISTATLDYDRNQYIFFSAESKNNPPVRKIVATVEVYTETDLTNAIIGGTVGGLVLLALITAGLYKAGFFKSQYKQMIDDQGGEGQGPVDGGAQPPAKQQ